MTDQYNVPTFGSTDLVTEVLRLKRRVDELERHRDNYDFVEFTDGTVIYPQGQSKLVYGENKIFRQSAAPTGLNASTDVGSRWVDSDTEVESFWDGFVWVAYGALTPAFPGAPSLAAMGPALISRSLSSFRLYSQTSNPAGPAHGWMVRRTDLANQISRWNGSAWVVVTDTNIINAVNAAIAQATMTENYLVVHFTTTAPTGKDAVDDQGDLWYETSNNYKEYSWDGFAWKPSKRQIRITDFGTATGTTPVGSDFAVRHNAGAIPECIIVADNHGQQPYKAWPVPNLHTTTTFTVRLRRITDNVAATVGTTVNFDWWIVDD